MKDLLTRITEHLSGENEVENPDMLLSAAKREVERLPKLEKVAEAARKVSESIWTAERALTEEHWEDRDGLMDALAELDAKGVG